MRALACVALVAAASFVILPSPGHAVVDPIQPGDYVEFPGSFCTLGFVFDGAGGAAGRDTFIATAAHCIPSDPGHWQAKSDGWYAQPFGEVAYVGDADALDWDFALIRIHPGVAVEAAVRGHPGAPTGVASSSATQIADPVGFSGWGIGYDLTAPTREWRPGVLGRDGSGTFTVAGPFINGDSGGPFFMANTGLALGLESRVALDGFGTDTGPLVTGMMGRLAYAGWPVTLRTI